MTPEYALQHQHLSTYIVLFITRQSHNQEWIDALTL